MSAFHVVRVDGTLLTREKGRVGVVRGTGSYAGLFCYTQSKLRILTEKPLSAGKMLLSGIKKKFSISFLLRKVQGLSSILS